MFLFRLALGTVRFHSETFRCSYRTIIFSFCQQFVSKNYKLNRKNSKYETFCYYACVCNK
nr:MAG TPA: hypothetical protein [Bacteriophage sp.]